MQLSNPHFHVWTYAAVAAIALLALMLPKTAGSQGYTPGYYTTSSTSTSSTTGGVTTTNTTTNTPASIYRAGSRGDRNADYWRNARNSGSDVGYRNRAARDEDADPQNTSDLEARYPYDNTNGRHRSDVDAARTGFDDPRNPWDGRYSNDNPSNAVNSNDRVNALRGSEESRNRGNDRYRPGSYGTSRVAR